MTRNGSERDVRLDAPTDFKATQYFIGILSAGITAGPVTIEVWNSAVERAETMAGVR